MEKFHRERSACHSQLHAQMTDSAMAALPETTMLPPSTQTNGSMSMDPETTMVDLPTDNTDGAKSLDSETTVLPPRTQITNESISGPPEKTGIRPPTQTTNGSMYLETSMPHSTTQTTNETMTVPSETTIALPSKQATNGSMSLAPEPTMSSGYSKFDAVQGPMGLEAASLRGKVALVTGAGTLKERHASFIDSKSSRSRTEDNSCHHFETFSLSLSSNKRLTKHTPPT